VEVGVVDAAIRALPLHVEANVDTTEGRLPLVAGALRPEDQEDPHRPVAGALRPENQGDLHRPVEKDRETKVERGLRKGLLHRASVQDQRKGASRKGDLNRNRQKESVESLVRVLLPRTVMIMQMINKSLKEMSMVPIMTKRQVKLPTTVIEHTISPFWRCFTPLFFPPFFCLVALLSIQ